MSNQQVRMRTEQSLEFVKNGRDSVSLDRGMVYRELVLKLSCEIDSDGANAVDGTNIRPGDLWAVVKRLNLKLNSNDNIRSISGEQLAWLNLLLYNSTPRLPYNLLNLGTGTGASEESYLVLPLWMPNSVKPIDTALDATLLSDLKLEIEWGDIADITSATDAAFATNPQIDVYTLESFGLEGPFNTARLFEIEYDSVPNTDNYRIDLPVNNMYRAFLIETKDGSGNDLADAIDNIRLRSGTTHFVDVDARALREWYYLRNGLMPVYDDANEGEFPWFASDNSDRDAWTFLDLVTDGFLTESLDTLGFSSLTMELKTNQSIDTLRVVPIEIIPLRDENNG